MRPTLLEVNITALKKNLNLVRTITNNKEIIAVIKANAYGLGSVAVAKALLESGLSTFAVAILDEAVILREGGISNNIIQLCPFSECEIPDIINYSVTSTIVDYKRAKALNDYAHSRNIVLAVHIKVDSGMGRLGVRADGAFELIKRVYNLTNLRVEGIFTHFSSADIPDIDYTNYQIKVFSNLVNRCRDIDFRVIYHLANSGAIIFFSNSYFDAVRPGLMLYGCYPSLKSESSISLNKVLTLKTKIVSVKELLAGESVSYGRTFRAKSKMTYGVLPIGYADGYSTLLSNKGRAMVNGVYVPVIGRVCMDYTMVDLRKVNAKEGDEAILIGDGITEEEIAHKTGLIPYEVITGITERVPRVYRS